MSARVLITGASGFLGGHLARACAAGGDAVVGLSRSGRVPADGGAGMAVDLLDAGAARAAVRDARPDVVHHLAALASTGRSWEDPERCLADNLRSTWSLLDAVRAEAPGARVLIAASGEGYGPPARLPVDESAPLRPQSPYAVAKVTSDLLGGFFADAHGLSVVRARAFNSAGPGQPDTFLVGSLTRQAAAGVLAGDDPVRVSGGAPDVRRDFTDVRDVVRAFRALAGGGVEPGAYNVASGRPASARDVASVLEELVAPARLVHDVDPALVRPHETPEVVGSAERLHAATGWAPEIPFEQTVADGFAWWRERLGSE